MAKREWRVDESDVHDYIPADPKLWYAVRSALIIMALVALIAWSFI